MLKRANLKVDDNDVTDETRNLRELKHNVLAEEAKKKGVKQWLEDMTEFSL